MIKICDLKDFLKNEERGFGVDIFGFFLNNKEKFKDIHFVSIKPKSIRGNHLHKSSKEWIFLWEGKFLFCFKEGKVKREEIIEVKNPIIILIPEGVPHCLKNIDKKELYILSFGSKFPMDFEKSVLIE